jgi:hypothetical protein
MSKSVRRATLTATAVGLVAVLSAGHARAQQTEAEMVDDPLQRIVKSHVDSQRDDLYWAGRNKLTMPPVHVMPSLHFTNERSSDPVYEDAFGALGYAGKPMATKAMPTKAPPAPASTLTTGAWASLTADFENQSGIFNGANIGVKSQTYTGIGGVDFTKTHFTNDTDAFLIGVLGGGTVSYTQPFSGAASTTTTSGTGGVYAAYVPGDFSVDWSYTATPSRSVTGGLAAAAVSVTTYTFSNNAQYRITASNMWWFEPTVGYSYSDGVWSAAQHAAGFADNKIWRVQGGARAGTSYMMANGVTVEPTYSLTFYSDVSVSGASTKPGAVAAAPTDQGQLWAKGDAKFNFAFADNLSAYVEGEVHGTGNNGSGSTLGGSATVGVRKTW